MERNPQDDESVALQSQNANYFYEKGLSLLDLDNKEDYIKAVDYFAKAIEINPKHSNAFFNKGYALYLLGERRSAEECYERAMELNNLNANARFSQGLALNKLKNKEDYKKAVDYFDEAIKINPDHSNAFYHRGFAQYLLGETEKAEASYQEAINKNGKNSNAYYNQGYANFRLRNYAKAIDCYDKAIKLNPMHSNAFNYKGLALERLAKSQNDETENEKFEAALNCYKKAIEHNVTNRDAQGNIINTLFNFGEFNEISEYQIKFNNLDRNYESTFQYELEGNFDNDYLDDPFVILQQ